MKKTKNEFKFTFLIPSCIQISGRESSSIMFYLAKMTFHVQLVSGFFRGFISQVNLNALTQSGKMN